MIIVIGGSSFIGVHTIEELLKQKCDVLATGRNNKFKQHYADLGIEYINLDITNKKDFDKLPTKNIECVILLAGLLPANVAVNLDKDENAGDYFTINVLGCINVLEYCRINNIRRVISTSSYADVYNSWSASNAITEKEPRNFKYFGDHAVYVISKNAANDVIEYYNQQHQMSNAIFRLPPVYGIGPHGSLFVNGTYVKSGFQIFVEKAKLGEDIVIFGDKELSRDIIYVKDVAHAFYLAIQSDKTYGLYNMTSGKGLTIREQAEIIANTFGSDNNQSKIIYEPEIPNNTSSYLFSIEKAKRDFGFIPQYADFKVMMTDYKRELDEGKYRKLFQY
jgi:UDP-glucose 4-epimerase